MKEQNFKNHGQMVPGFHFVTFTLLFALLGGAINFIIKCKAENIYLASLVLLISIVFVLIAWYTRVFALKAQDRAIYAQENLRYYVLTNKLLPRELSVLQVVALRFASDAEYVALVEKAAKENLSSKEIKLSIQNWKADWYRV
jgi:hypothetical protein